MDDLRKQPHSLTGSRIRIGGADALIVWEVTPGPSPCGLPLRQWPSGSAAEESSRCCWSSMAVTTSSTAGASTGPARRQHPVSHCETEVLHSEEMPTTKPRYTLTDTGHLAELLDAAAHRWPDVADRKQLLLRLAEEGHQALAGVDLAVDVHERRRRAGEALERIPSLVDTAVLLADKAWT